MYLQVPMCVVGPGKQPKTFSERVLSTSSGHIIHLMPGDHTYDPVSFNIVVVWNGLNHYIPSYLVHHSSILQYKCSLINQLLRNATEIFSDIESDLDESQDEMLIDKFHSLRDTTVQAQHLLNLKGAESTHFPSSTAGPDPRDSSKHLTRKTPLPVKPKPLLRYALPHAFNLDSALKCEHPTPIVPLPPAADSIKTEDFELDPEEYDDDSVRCIKVPGQIAPGRLLPSKMEIWCSIPYPLDPCKGHPPAHKDSPGAKNYRKGLVPPPSQAEFVEAAKNYPNRGQITQTSKDKQDLPKDNVVDSDQQGKPVLSGPKDKKGKPVLSGPKDKKGKPVLSGPKQSTSRITQTSKEGLPSKPVDVNRVEDSGRITQIVIPDDEAAGESSIISETVIDITLDDNGEEVIMEKTKDEEEKEKNLKALKRKLIPSRKSPRVKLPKLDMQAGVKTGLDKKQKTLVESLAKGIVSTIKPKQSQGLPTDRSKGGQPSSSLSSSQPSVRQKSILQMYARAALRIPQQTKKHVPVSQGAQQTQMSQQSHRSQGAQQTQKSQQSHRSQGAQQTQKSQQSHRSQGAQQTQKSQQSQKYKQSLLPGSQRITHTQSQPVMPHRIAQVDPEKGTILSCTFCTYTTLRKESLNDHLKMHTGEKIQCTKCSKSYFSKKSFRNHYKIVHLQKDRCFCTEAGCTWSGKDYGNRRVHLYKEHGIGEAPICEHPDCKDRGHFSNFRTLERHRETFHKGKDLQCPHCDRKYKDLENLRNHIDVHHKGKSAYQCEICGQFYTSQKTLAAHKKEHD